LGLLAILGYGEGFVRFLRVQFLDICAVAKLVQDDGDAFAVTGGEDVIQESRFACSQIACT